MEIRRLRQDEWSVLRDLRERAVTDSPDEMGESLRELQTRTSDQHWIEKAKRQTEHPERFGIFVAELGGSFYGTIDADIQDGEPSFVSLSALWVAPEVRSRGIGERIVSAALRWAKERGAARARILVAETNHSALMFYERLGFVKDFEFPMRPPQAHQRFWWLSRHID
jgi:ribosomal protein S18 acetylase RimI-like enzyme